MQHDTGDNVKKWVLYLLLAIISFGIYANTLQNGYVLDDGMVLKDNVFVKQGIEGIPHLLSTPRSEGAELNNAGDFYRPLSMVVFAIEVEVFGMNPTAGHFFNILVFIGCVLMLFRFLDRLMEQKRTTIAFIAAFLFAVHPIHTEVVANIKSRDELLCYFFGFWSLTLFVSYIKSRKIGYLLLGALTLLLAFLSKETVIAFVIMVPLLFFFYHNENRQKSIAIVLCTVVVTGIFFMLRSAVLNQEADDGNIGFMENALVNAPDTATRIATEILILGKYLKLLFIPYPLLCNYSYNSIPFASFGDLGVWASLLVYVSLIGIAVYRMVKKKKDLWAFAVLFYLVTLALFSNMVFLVGAEMAERFLFFASTGFCFAMALAFEQWIFKSQSADATGLKDPKTIVVLMVFLLGFGGLTIARNMDWKSNYTLYTADIKKSPDDARLYYWLAAELSQNLYAKETDAAKQKELDKQSIGYLQRSISIYPEFSDALAELAWLYQRNNMPDSAYYFNSKALQYDPNSSDANNNMGNLYFSEGKYPQAIEYLNKAIAGNPKFKVAHLALAGCYLQMRQYDDAIMHANKVLELDPDNMDAHQVLGNAYMQKEEHKVAEEHFSMVVKAKPGYVQAINNLGVIYLDTKRYSEAIEQFNKVLSLNASYLNAYSNLGRAYFFTGQYDAAINIINKKMKLDTNNITDIPILALCYQKTGNTELAMKYEAAAQQKYPGFKLE
jgi:tetratricopeptide (TPR) repeat protein